jgi:hypothetical protein
LKNDFLFLGLPPSALIAEEIVELHNISLTIPELQNIFGRKLFLKILKKVSTEEEEGSGSV